jgi:hypothetical protein
MRNRRYELGIGFKYIITCDNEKEGRYVAHVAEEKDQDRYE